jgi:hypothetical protein
MFYHFSPSPAPDAATVEVVKVPVLDLDHWATGYVQIVTMVVVLGGALWVGWALVRVLVGDFGARLRGLGGSDAAKKEKSGSGKGAKKEKMGSGKGAKKRN